MELKKSYKGFIIWMLLYVVSCFSLCFLPIVDSVILTRLSLNMCTIGVAILAFIIYKTEYIYWYNGITYEDAVKAGSERRKNYAWKHCRRFGGCALICLVCSIVFHIVGISMWYDIFLVSIGIVAAAISTITIKL